MTYAMLLRLPVSVAFGTDEEFDLRVRLERELAAALPGAGVSGEIGTTHLELRAEEVADPGPALAAAKEVLARSGRLGGAVVLLETPCPADPDDREWRVLWPPHQVGAYLPA
ncbi:MAG: hypothetical protein C0501_04280 [Isosphaera sp.]|nr:hypothetical protein [Isosphaera sp.]